VTEFIEGANSEDASATLVFFSGGDVAVAELFLRRALSDLYRDRRGDHFAGSFVRCTNTYTLSWATLPISPNSLGTSPASEAAPEKTEPGGLGEIKPARGEPTPAAEESTTFFFWFCRFFN